VIIMARGGGSVSITACPLARLPACPLARNVLGEARAGLHNLHFWLDGEFRAPKICLGGSVLAMNSVAPEGAAIEGALGRDHRAHAEATHLIEDNQTPASSMVVSCASSAMLCCTYRATSRGFHAGRPMISLTARLLRIALLKKARMAGIATLPASLSAADHKEFLRLGRPKEALDAAKAIFARTPENRRSLTLGAQACRMLKPGDEGIGFQCRLIALAPGDERVRLCFAPELAKFRRQSGAVQVLEQGFARARSPRSDSRKSFPDAGLI